MLVRLWASDEVSKKGLCKLWFLLVFKSSWLYLKHSSPGISLVVKWLAFTAPTAGVTSSIPGRGTRFYMPCSIESEVAQSCLTLCDHGHQAPLPMGFSRQEYWSGLPLPKFYSSGQGALVFSLRYEHTFYWDNGSNGFFWGITMLKDILFWRRAFLIRDIPCSRRTGFIGHHWSLFGWI